MRWHGLALLSVLGTGACAPAFEVAVSGLRDATIRRPATYVLLPAMEGVDTLDLQYLEVKQYLRRALANQDLREASGPRDADAVFFVSYGIGEPKSHDYAYSMPVYGRIGGGTTNYSGTTYGPGGSVTTTGTATSQPRVGVVGQRSVAGSYTTFSRYISLVAFDLAYYRETQTLRKVWHTAVVSVGSSGDLRQVLPIMVAAAGPYWGTDTGKAIFVGLKETDPRVTAIKGSATSR